MFSSTHCFPRSKQNSKQTSFLSLFAGFHWISTPPTEGYREKRAPSGCLIGPEAMAVKFNQRLLLDQAAVNSTNKYGHPPHADNVQFDSAPRRCQHFQCCLLETFHPYFPRAAHDLLERFGGRAIRSSSEMKLKRHVLGLKCFGKPQRRPATGDE